MTLDTEGNLPQRYGATSAIKCEVKHDTPPIGQSARCGCPVSTRLRAYLFEMLTLGFPTTTNEAQSIVARSSGAIGSPWQISDQDNYGAHLTETDLKKALEDILPR